MELFRVCHKVAFSAIFLSFGFVLPKAAQSAVLLKSSTDDIHDIEDDLAWFARLDLSQQQNIPRKFWQQTDDSVEAAPHESRSMRVSGQPGISGWSVMLSYVYIQCAMLYYMLCYVVLYAITYYDGTYVFVAFAINFPF